METYHSLKDLPNGTGDLIVAPDEDRVGTADDIREDVGTEIAGRADHVREAHEERGPLVESASDTATVKRHLEAYRPTEDEGAEERPDKAFHRLLGAELDERRLAEHFA
jgi:hypothetical protein